MVSCSFAVLGFVQMIEPPVELIGTVKRVVMMRMFGIRKLWRKHENYLQYIDRLFEY